MVETCEQLQPAGRGPFSVSPETSKHSCSLDDDKQHKGEDVSCGSALSTLLSESYCDRNMKSFLYERKILCLYRQMVLLDLSADRTAQYSGPI